MLLTIFSPIQKRLCKLLKYQDIKTDNVLFRLHCILTVAVLLGSSVLLTTTQLVGKPIECVTSLSDKIKDWSKAIETWCWVNSTFLMPVEIEQEIQVSTALKDLLRSQSQSIHDSLSADGRRVFKVGENMAYPGVMNEYDTEQPKRYYTYYQWVCFVLFLQGIFCYLPKLLWDKIEDGLLTKLATGLQGTCFKDELEKRTDSIICYIQRYRKAHTKYALAYWFCELLCLLNLVMQMWMMNAFLGGNFFSYGLKALKYSDMPQYERSDPLIYIFPRITKCTFYYHGPSGGINILDNLCVLPQNIINEKVYIILWFWYIILSVLFVCVLIYRILLVATPRFRPRLLVARTRCVTIADAEEVTSMLDLGDWWLLYMLSKNMDPLAYRDLLTDFIKREKKVSLYK